MDRVLAIDASEISVIAALSIEQVAAEFGLMLQRMARTHEADPGIAEELVQEMLLAIWRALPSYRGQASHKTFIARIAMNHAVDHVRRALRQGRTAELPPDLPDTREGPEQQVFAQDERARLLSAVQRLPLPYRQAALLTLEGLSVGEVAAVLGITANAVSVRLSKAKSFLRNELGATR